MAGDPILARRGCGEAIPDDGVIFSPYPLLLGSYVTLSPEMPGIVT